MEQLKVFANLLYALFTAYPPLLLELNTIICSLMEYKPASRVLVKSQQRAAIAWIIPLQKKYFFCGDYNQLAELLIMNNNFRAQNHLIYHAEVPLAIYSDYSPPAAGQKRKFYRDNKPMEDSRSNKKANTKVKIHELLRKHFTNGIWKVNPSIRFRDMASFCNVHTSAQSKDGNVFTLGMFQRCSSPYCKKTHRKATYEEAKHMFNVLDKSIKNPDQVQAVSAGEKGN